MSQWIRTADKLPEHDDKVLAVVPWEGIIIAWYQHGGKLARGRWWCDHAGTIEPTHWMPLPEPPNTEENN